MRRQPFPGYRHYTQHRRPTEGDRDRKRSLQPLHVRDQDAREDFPRERLVEVRGPGE